MSSIISALPDAESVSIAIVGFVLILSVLVFIHEMGHYLVARWNGVKVEVFSIGFGREIFGWNDKSGTRWKVSLLPLGGYVKMFGDADAASTPDGNLREMTEEEKQVSFHHKRLGQRSAVVAAGPAANFLLAIVLLAGLFLVSGQPYTPTVIGQVMDDSPAKAAGFEPNDRIIAIDGKEVERFEDLQRIVALSPGEDIVFTVLRDGREVELPTTIRSDTAEDSSGNRSTRGYLGVGRSGVEYREIGPLTAVGAAFTETWNLTIGTLKAVGQIITGQRGADELGGPIRIAEMSGQALELGIGTVIWFAAVLSINLGLINLFPVPMLDGGHLLFYAFEAVRGKPLGERTQEYGFRIGLALVLGLMIFVTWNDIARSWVGDIFRGLGS
jgi:regulator of sigma E protease